jgi:hypothetical protein
MIYAGLCRFTHIVRKLKKVYARFTQVYAGLCRFTHIVRKLKKVYARFTQVYAGLCGLRTGHLADDVPVTRGHVPSTKAKMTSMTGLIPSITE